MIMTNNDSDNTTLTLANLQNTIPNPPHSNTPYAAVVLSLYIAPQCVGTLIGRGGKTIHSIMRDAGKISLNPSVWVKILENSSTSPNTGTGTGTNLNSQVHPVEQAMDDAPQQQHKLEEEVDDWTRVLIRGDAVGVFAAARLIIQLLTSNNTNNTNHTNGNGNDSRQNHHQYQDNESKYNSLESYDESNLVDLDVVLDIPLNRYRQHGAVVGKRGATIAALSADHNVRIFVPHKQAMYEGSNNANMGGRDNKDVPNVQLEGALDNVEKCLTQMLAIVAGKVKGNSTPPVFIHDDEVLAQLASSIHRNDTYHQKYQGQTYQQSQRPVSKSRQHSSSKETIKRESTSSTPTQQKQQVESLDTKYHTKQETKKKGESKSNADDNETNTDEKSGHTAVIVAPSHASVPSLAQLRQIGKKTGTIIRRKRVPVEELERAEDVGDNVRNKDTNKTNKDEVESTTAFTVTGRSDLLKVVQALFDRVFSGELVDTVIESIPKRSSNKYRRKKGNKVEKKNEVKGKEENNLV